MTSRSLTRTAKAKEQGICHPMRKRLFTLREAAEYMGRSVWGMRELIWAGAIPTVKAPAGRKIFLDVVDLDAYIDANKAVYR